MIEPWVSTWSNLVYTRFHHEPFVPQADSWEIPETGPLSGANGALPWIIFERDRKLFDRQFPSLSIDRISPMMPWRYLVSGGVSMRNLMPGIMYSFWKGVERVVSPFNQHLGMFALICLRRT